ncbi:ABC transporter substrate-binding protein [Lyngbya confervoides]|uniref:ABC transporter substrate-binding protein n=1 Tax=Lyngbya confervoides BDU141951 TaxID=1574623 RepID=A0ABD4SZP0_9CYAN|nr:ABC transporter substrate-binding protein [Lyngbya confervoides]MCM1981886.1 ABC transporter substrate-binding protein [Lyngbya confervoides BDU141951]
MPHRPWCRRAILRRCFLAGLAVVLLTTLGNCSAPQTPESGQSQLLVFGSGGQPVNLTPGNVTDGNSIYAQRQLYNTLLGTEAGRTDLVPELATNWTSSEDGRTWTFTLREGLKFHDGTPCNAEAVVFNVQRWWDPEFDFGDRDQGNLYEIWPNLFGGFKGDPASILASVQAPDPQTVVFQLTTAFAAFPAAISSGYFGIASPTAIRSARSSYGKPSGPAVGTGPFVLQDWRSGDRLTLTKNQTYWQRDRPRAETLILRFVEDPAARLAQLRSGTLDFTVDLTPDQRPEIEQDPQLQSVVRPSLNVGYLALNPSYDPLSKPEVRRALAQSLNKSEIVQAFWGDLGQTDGHFIPPALGDFRAAEVSDYPYDPAAARQALAQAGYPNGFDLDLWYMPVSRPYFPNPKPIAEALAAELSQIGIRVKLQTKDWGSYLADRNRAPGFQAFMLGWTADYADPDNFLYAHFGPGSTQDLGGYQNSQLFTWLNQARSTPDPARRQQLYQNIDQLLFTEALRIPIVHSQPLLAQRSRLRGWQPSPLGSEDFAAVEK